MQRYFCLYVLLLITISILESHGECWTDDAPHMVKCIQDEGPPTNVSLGSTRVCRCRNTCRSLTLKCETFQSDVDWQFNGTICLDVDPAVYHECDLDPNMLMSYTLGKITHACKAGYVLHGDIVTTCDNGTIVSANSPHCSHESHSTEIGLSFGVAILVLILFALVAFLFLNRDSIIRVPNWIRLSERTTESC